MQPVIYTSTGRKINPLELLEDDIDVADLAHALALCNRFAGHTVRPISVAQHCVYASYLGYDLSDQVRLQALLHDAAEAYLGDVTKWLKGSPVMAGYREAEDRVQRAIYRKFGLPEEDHPAVTAADRLLVRYEGRQGFGHHWHVCGMQPGAAGLYPELTAEEIKRCDSLFGGWEFWTWQRAESQYLSTFRLLYRS